MTKKKKTLTKQSKTSLFEKEKGPVYDKILRENLMEVFLPLIKEQLDFEIKTIQQLPDKQETTIERETDAFLLVESTKGMKSILHIEFQTADDHSMIYRNAEYHGIELRKYKLPIKHIVIYIGEKKPTMPTELKPELVYQGFDLVDIQSFKPEVFLSTQVPEKIILAILCNYPKVDTEKVLNAIFNKLRRVCKSEKQLKKFIKQLIIFSQLRNLDQLTIEKSRNMPILVDPTQSYLYKLGAKEKEKQLQEELKLERARQEKERARQEKERARQEKERARQETKAALKAMKRAGLSLGLMLDFSQCKNIEEVQSFLSEIEKDEQKA